MAEHEITIETGVLGHLFKNTGKSSAEAHKNLATDVLKNP